MLYREVNVWNLLKEFPLKIVVSNFTLTLERTSKAISPSSASVQTRRGVQEDGKGNILFISQSIRLKTVNKVKKITTIIVSLMTGK